jgi:hypothetical protein
MKPRNIRVLAFAVTAAAMLVPAWAQAPVHPRPQPKKDPKPPQVVVKETPVEQGDSQQQPAPQDPAPPQDQAAPQQTPPQDQTAPPQPTAPPEQGTAPQAPPAQGTTPPAQAGPKIVKPEEIGISFAPPQGWQQGDPTKFSLPGDICCAWSPDNVASIVAFVQRPGKPLNPKVLLEQSAQALQSAVGADVKTKEIKDIGGMKGFSLVVTAPGNGAAIDGKGSVSTTQHWVAVPRDKDVVIFLMTTPDESFAQNEQVFQGVLSTLKISGTQTPDQQASK